MPSTLTLVADDGPLKGLTLDWKDGGSIGRDAANALALKDNGISRRHASIGRDGAGWVLIDLNSRNGSLVNGKRVQRQALADGDLIRIGAVTLRCVILPEEEAAEADPGPAEPSVTEAITKQSLDFLKAEAPDSPESLARSSARLLALFDFARAAAEAPTLEALWAKASEALSGAIAADRAFVLKPVGQSGEWQPFRPSADGAGAPGIKAPVSATVAAYVREKGDSVLCAAPGSDRRFAASQSLVSAPVASVLCVPVRQGGRTLGALYADRLGSAPAFNHSDLELAIAFAIALAAPWAQAARQAQLEAGRAALERQLEAHHDLIGSSPAMREVLSLIKRAAPTPSAVLITGESGVGKELVARALHKQSARSEGPFEVVNCAALTETLFESELFGHQRGSFTGAHEDKRGRFELADGGTLFLDEIGDIPESCQTKLLRILEDGQVRRVGDTKDRQVDVRVVAATNRDLEAAGSRFRRDLFYRLNVFRISVPPLKERREDVPLLAAHYTARFSAACRKPPKAIAPEVLAVLQAHAWPGNVRELKNCLERMVVLSDRPALELDDLPGDLRGGVRAVEPPGDAGPLVPLEEVEKAHILRVLAALGGNKKRAAEVLGIDRGTLYAKMKRFGLGDARGG